MNSTNKSNDIKLEEVASGVLSCNMMESFSNLFLNGWLKEYHSNVGDGDIQIAEWNGNKKRDMLYRRKIGFETGVKEYQHWYLDEDHNMNLWIEGKCEDAPFGKSYKVITNIILKAIDNKSCRMKILFGVTFSKRPFLAGQIQHIAKKQARNDYSTLIKMATEKMKKNSKTAVNGVEKGRKSLVASS